MEIQSFRDQQLIEFIEKGKLPKNCQWQRLKSIALRKLDMLNYATKLTDLKVPPGNHLEQL